jgi:hypothetical protein
VRVQIEKGKERKQGGEFLVAAGIIALIALAAAAW